MDKEGDSIAHFRLHGANTKRGHQTAKEDAPTVNNPKPTDFEVAPATAHHTLTSEEADQLEQFKVKEGSVVWMMLGIAGAGKSFLGNFIIGQDESFPESLDFFKSETDKAALKCSSFDTENLCVIDTPGLCDTRRIGSRSQSGSEDLVSDYSALATELTKVMMMDPRINAFLIVVPIRTDYRSLIALLDFCDIIGKYWSHSILVVTPGQEIGKSEEEQYAMFHAELARPRGSTPLENILDRVRGRLVIVGDRPEYHRSVVGKIMKYSKEITERHGPFKDDLQSIGQVANEMAKLKLRHRFEDMNSPEARAAVFQSTFKHVRDVVYRLVRITTADAENVDKMKEMAKVKAEELNEVRKQKDTYANQLKEMDNLGEAHDSRSDSIPQNDRLIDSPPPPSPPPPPPPPPPPSWTEQYKKAIEQRGSVTVHITRCVLIGPPRVGKSSLKLLLINNEPPDQRVEKSTDLMEAPVVLTSMQCQEKKGSRWKELTPNSLQQLVSKCTREEEYNPAQPNPMQSSHTSLSTAVTSDTDHVSTTVAESSNTSMHLAVDSELERRYHDFVGATMSEESRAELKMNGLKVVHVFDCGGQLAFQDTIPLLINAPCAFISVFNASIDLDEEVELKYCPEKGKELSLGHMETQWNMLSCIFSSIHSLQLKCHGDILHLIKDKTVPSSPIAVVGTHKDMLCDSSKEHEGLRQRIEEKIKKRLEEWRESKPYDFVREKGCTLDLVANLSKDDLSAIASLRNDITKSKATLSLELPLSWIILELFTRSSQLEKKFVHFLDLQQLCFHNDIVSHNEEFLSLLQVLHVLGFYAFYQLNGVPEDQNWVCTDAATLYKEVTKMLLVQYKEYPKKGATIELQQYGRIKLNKATLQDVFTDLEISIGGADPMWLIRVLLHIGLAAKIVDEGQEEAFIPLALPFKRSDLPPVTSVDTICFTLEFPTGSSKSRVRASVTEIPRGIFPRLIVHLLSQQRAGERCEWLVDEGDSRSRIKLSHHSDKYVIYLSELVDHIELDLVLNDTFLPTKDNDIRTTKVGNLCHELCERLKFALGATFVSVFGEQPPERKPSVVCGLKCSACHDSSHMAIVQPAKEPTPQHPLYTEKCVHKRLPRIIERSEQLIWFSPEKGTTFKKETTQDGQWTIWRVMKGTGTSKLGDKPSSIELLDAVIPKVAADWEVLSIRLKLEDKGRIIAEDYAKVEDRCLHILRAWTNGEGQKPVTWETLLKVMGKCGYKDLADELAERLKRGETLEKE